MDALTFIWSHFALFCIVGSIIAVAVENAKERKKELKQLKRENQVLKKEIEFQKLIIKLKGVKI